MPRKKAKKKDRNNWIGGIAIFLVVIAILLIGGWFALPHKISRVCKGLSCISVEIADTDEARVKGLMGRTSMAQDHGMLFVFDKDGNYPFWMKDTIMPLDIVWVDASWNVVQIMRHNEPCLADPCQILNPGKIARYVMEINAGEADRLGLEVGDKLRAN